MANAPLCNLFIFHPQLYGSDPVPRKTPFLGKPHAGPKDKQPVQPLLDFPGVVIEGSPDAHWMHAGRNFCTFFKNETNDICSLAVPVVGGARQHVSSR
jgi:hypothetical protein